MAKLHYHISNNGDGSASVHFHQTYDEAVEADEKESESGDGWGESCNGSVNLKVVDGQIFYEDYGYTNGKFGCIWKPVGE